MRANRLFMEGVDNELTYADAFILFSYGPE